MVKYSYQTNFITKEVAAIYRQEIMQDISFFTNQPKAKFYNELFLHFDTNAVEEATAKTGNPGFGKSAMLCAFVVMKCEGFAQITDLLDYLENNLLIAYYCGFDITKSLPSYWTYSRFLKQLDNELLQKTMQAQVLRLVDEGVIDASFIGLDSTPVMANTRHNNKKAFMWDKFNPEKQPKADKDCKLGVHTASNQVNERKFEYYWGYKNHVLVDCITGLPICEVTTTANEADSTLAEDILSKTNSFLPIKECCFIADKGYDTKHIYNLLRDIYEAECFIPLNKRNTKNHKKLPVGNPICDAGLAMHRDGKFSDNGRTRQKFCCPFKRSRNGECPCNHKNWNNGKKNRGCTKYVTIPDDYRLAIDREHIHFKSVYALRTECERYNSRFKSTGQERLWVRNLNSAKNLNTIAHISLLAIAIAAVITQSDTSYRAFKSVKRVA